MPYACREGQAVGPAALVLRYSVRVSSPGCVAMVLEALSPRPPYALENRTPHPLLFRAVGAAKTAGFQQLPPYSSAGWAPPTTATPRLVTLQLSILC